MADQYLFIFRKLYRRLLNLALDRSCHWDCKRFLPCCIPRWWHNHTQNIAAKEFSIFQTWKLTNPISHEICSNNHSVAKFEKGNIVRKFLSLLLYYNYYSTIHKDIPYILIANRFLGNLLTFYSIRSITFFFIFWWYH